MDEADPAELRARATRYRQLVRGIIDPRATQALNDLATECETKAVEAETREPGQPSPPKYTL